MANFNWAQMLFDEPMATQGFRTTGNDPLNQFASWYQFGQNLRQGAEARRARKEAQEMARAEAEKEALARANGNPNGTIGFDTGGAYSVTGGQKVYDNPAQPSGGIGVDASGVHGVEQPTTGSYGNFTGQIPNSPYPVNNSSTLGGLLGGDLGKLVTTSGLDLLKGLKGGGNADNSMNITNQTIGQNYNNRIDSQYNNGAMGGATGMNMPRTPQQNGFGTAISNAENPLNSFTGGSLVNFLNPVSSGDSAQVAGGATNLSADNPFARSSKYLGADYDKMAYIKSALDSGVKNPLVAMAMYDQMIAPLRESAKEDELRNAFFVLQSPESSNQDKMNAVALIQYYKKDPYMAENQQMKRDKAMYDMGYLPEGDFGYGDADGGEYGGEDANAGAIYSHLASKGVPANVIAGIMGNLQAESGFNSSAVGDNGQSIGLAQWYDSRGNNLRNFAQQRGKDWTDIPTQVDFLLSEIQQSNPDLLQRMSKLSPHDAAILFHDEFEKSADSPEMKDRRGQYAEGIYGNRIQGGSRNGRYRRDPYRVSPREQFNYNQQRDAMNYALRNRAIDARLAAKTGKVNSANGLWSSDDDIVGIFNKNALKENPASGQAMLSIVGQFAPKYRELIQRGLPPEQARGAIQAALIKQLGADNIANMGKERFNDMMDSIINGTSSVAQQKNNSSQGGASGSVDGSVIDNIKAKGWDVIKNMIPQNRENLNPDPYRNDVEDTAFEKADARRRVIEAARKEGLEFDEYTNELRPIGGRWGNLFNSREKQEEINRKIASFKSRYAI